MVPVSGQGPETSKLINTQQSCFGPLPSSPSLGPQEVPHPVERKALPQPLPLKRNPSLETNSASVPLSAVVQLAVELGLACSSSFALHHFLFWCLAFFLSPTVLPYPCGAPFPLPPRCPPLPQGVCSRCFRTEIPPLVAFRVDPSFLLHAPMSFCDPAQRQVLKSRAW